MVGTPGGTTIPTSVYQSIVNVIDFKMTPSSAVNSAKFHHQWLPEIVFVEKISPENTIENFRTKNYKFENVVELAEQK